MTITPKQFSLLMRENLRDFVTKAEFNDKTDKILSAVDVIKKKFDDHDIEHASNLAAYDRFEKRITQFEKKARITA